MSAILKSQIANMRKYIIHIHLIKNRKNIQKRKQFRFNSTFVKLKKNIFSKFFSKIETWINACGLNYQIKCGLSFLIKSMPLN
jgi:hypothetical protein